MTNLFLPLFVNPYRTDEQQIRTIISKNVTMMGTLGATQAFVNSVYHAAMTNRCVADLVLQWGQGSGVDESMPLLVALGEIVGIKPY